MGNLGNQERSCGGGEGHAGTQNDAGSEEHGEVDGASLQSDADDDDEGTNDDSLLAAEVVAAPGDDGKAEQTAKRHGGTKQTETDTGGVVKVLLPEREGLQAVHHGPIKAVGDVDEDEQEAEDVELAQVGVLHPLDARVLATREEVETLVGPLLAGIVA